MRSGTAGRSGLPERSTGCSVRGCAKLRFRPPDAVESSESHERRSERHQRRICPVVNILRSFEDNSRHDQNKEWIGNTKLWSHGEFPLFYLVRF